MNKTKSMVIRHQSRSPSRTLTKSSLSKTLVYRTSKEFDHCAELLRNILSVQESRRNQKSSSISETKSKTCGQPSINNRTTKKQKSKGNISKSSLIKTNINNACALSQGGTEAVERRSTLVQETSNSKKHFHRSRFASPLTSSPTRGKSLSKTTKNQHEQRRRENSFPKPKQFVFDQFGKYLKQIQMISKQIRSRNLSLTKDSQCSRLWNEFDQCLSSALFLVNSDRLHSFPFEILQKQLIELKKELKTTNLNLNQRRDSTQYLNSIHSRRFFIENQQLKLKCDDLQMRFDELQRNNARLVQRLSERDLRLLVEDQRWITTNDRFLLRQEIVLLREKLSNLYEDLMTMINQDRSLRLAIEQQKRDIFSYKKFFEKSKESAKKLVDQLDHQSTENKIKEFLNEFLFEENQRDFSRYFLRQTKTSSSSSSTTIADADPTLSSSKSSTFVVVQQPNGENLRYNESESEFDRISDLTSKMFSSQHDEEDDGVFLDQSSSSSTISSSSFNEINRFV